MAGEITEIAKCILKSLASLAATKFLQLYHLNDDVAKLKSSLQDIEHLLRSLNEREGNHEPEDRDLIQKLEAAAYDVEDLIYSWETVCHLWKIKKQVRKFVLPFPVSELPFKYRISNELQRVVVTVKEIIEKGKENTSNRGSSHTESSKKKPETPSKPDNRIVGRKREVEEIIELLRDEGPSEGEKVTYIPIVGQGGVGKTLLAQLVFTHFDARENADSKHFDVTVWVSVTETFDVNQIYRTIVKNHSHKKNDADLRNLDFNSLSLDDLLRYVEKILKDKKFLLVLDDLSDYDPQEMDKLAVFLSEGGQGSKVLVTSRDEQILEEYSKSPFLLQCLDGNLSWSLFEKIAFRKDGKRQAFKEDGELQTFKERGLQIVSACGGLPLALKVMGNLVRGKPLTVWDNMAKSQIWRTGGEFPALRLSYNNLPTRLHRKCFEYLALFPKKHLFEKDELVKLWMAEGYVKPKENEKTEDIGAEYINDLLHRALLEFSHQDGGKYKMPDLMHDLAQTVSKPFCSRVTIYDLDEESPFNQDTRHVSLLTEEVEQPALEITRNSKKLRTLLFPVPHQRAFGKAQREVFHSLLYMHVLNMSSSTLQTLPDAIAKLKLLRYLDVSKTELRELPDSICYLHHLQTLKLLGCPYIFSLPKKFRFLVLLRHLELDEMFWFKVQAIPQSIGRLTNLHNLHKFQVGCNTGYKLEELKKMEHLTGKLHISNLENAVNAGKEKTSAGEANGPQVNAEEANLEGKTKIDKVVYEWSDSEINLQEDAIEKKVLEDLKPPRGITELRICHYRGSKFPSWMENGELQELVTIVLDDCNRVKTLSLGQLPNLKEVHLKNMQELEEWNEEEYESLDMEKANEEKYQPLRRVMVCNCPSLVKLPSCFSKLDALKIIKCKQLENIPSGPMRFITLEDNAVMKNWGEESLQVILEEEQVILDGGSEDTPPGVEEVILDGDNQDIPAEVKDVIFDGDNQDIPTENYVTQHLEARKVLIQSEVISQISLQLINLKIVRCPALSEFRRLFAPQKLEISDCSSLRALPDEYFAQRLSLLALDSCQGDSLLGNIPRSPSLLNLTITNIKDVSCLPTFPELPSLKTLHIHDCPDLEYLSTPENRLFERFTCLETLSIKNCPKLVTLPAEGLPTSLQYLSIGPCESLNSFGPPDVLVKLNSLDDLYIEACPALQSLPNDGLSSSLLHLSIKGCPSLMKNCAEGGSERQKIKDISDLEIETPSSSSSTAWYSVCFKSGGDNSQG